MILVTNSIHGDIVFEGDDDESCVKQYCELKNLPGIKEQKEDSGIWVLTDGTELDSIYSDDYFEL